MLTAAAPPPAMHSTVPLLAAAPREPSPPGFVPVTVVLMAVSDGDGGNTMGLHDSILRLHFTRFVAF